MEGGSHFDITKWGKMTEDTVAYFLSADGGLIPAEELDLATELLEILASCILIRTSGSSGKAKWVVHSKNSLLNHAALVNAHLEVTKNDIFGLTIPEYHVGGFGVIVRAIMSGAELVTMTEKWSASSCIDFIAKNNVSTLSFVPTQLVDIVAEHLRCPECVRVLVVGGGGLDPEVRRQAYQLGWPVKESYGMTETGSQIATGEFGISGFLEVIDGWKVRLSNEGVLEVKGDCLFKGYLVDHDGGFEFIDPKLDGWFVTSDLADLIQVDGKMGVKFLGRCDHQVKILGELVDISSLERQLMEILHHEIFLIPLVDQRRGVKLFPVVDDEILIEQIRDLDWSGLQRLEEVVVVPFFPRNEMGKLQRSKLREEVESIVFSAD